MKKLLMALLLIGFVFGCASTGEATADDAAAEEVVEKVLTPKEKAEVFNGDFSAGFDEWETDGASAGGKATFEVVDGVAVVDITNPGKEGWSVGLYSMQIPLVKKSVLNVSFDIKADADTTLKTAIEMDRAPYTTYGFTEVSLVGGDDWKRVEYVVDVFKDERSAQFSIAMGKAAATKIYIDNVVVTETLPE